MDKDFDFDNIGKRTPYRTPENFFEEAQHKILERTVGEQRRNRRLKRIIPAVIAVAAGGIWYKNSGKDFPVGILLGGELEDIEINFLHYKTFQQAEEAWNKRKKHNH